MFANYNLCQCYFGEHLHRKHPDKPVAIVEGEKTQESRYIICVTDPPLGLVTYNEADYKRCWLSTKEENEDKGASLLLQPGPEFFNQDDLYILIYMH